MCKYLVEKEDSKYRFTKFYLYANGKMFVLTSVSKVESDIGVRTGPCYETMPCIF